METWYWSRFTSDNDSGHKRPLLGEFRELGLSGPCPWVVDVRWGAVCGRVGGGVVCEVPRGRETPIVSWGLGPFSRAGEVEKKGEMKESESRLGGRTGVSRRGFPSQLTAGGNGRTKDQKELRGRLTVRDRSVVEDDHGRCRW